MGLMDIRRKIILNEPHIGTKSGSVVSFNSEFALPLKECKVSFAPVQSGEGNPSQDNVRNITGWNGLKLTYTNENLLGGDLLLENAKKHLPPMTDINTEEGTFRFSSGFAVDAKYSFSTGVKFKPNVRYTFVITLYKPSGTGANLRIYYTDGTYQQLTVSVIEEKTTIRAVSKANKTVSSLRKTNGSAWTKIYYRECGVFAGVHTIDEYEDGIPQYRGNTISVDWTDDAGIVYGGYADLVNGKLIVTKGYGMVSDYEWSITANTTDVFRASIDDKDYGNAGIISSHYKTVSNGITVGNMADGAIKANRNDIYRMYVYIRDSRYTTVEDFVEACGDAQICYNLLEPVTYQLTPEQIATLKGQNNFWSDANGEVEIKCWTH